MSVHKEIKRITTQVLLEMKARKEKIAMLTAYDYSMAKIFDAAGMDILLVGDSASNVMAGHETTLPITLDQMIYHASSVIRGVKRSFVVVDLPFGTYQGNSRLALESAIRIMKESGAHGVKLEGGQEIEESIKRILSAGIPVMGHLGLTPQSIYKFGTYTVRAKDEEEANKLKSDAKLLETIGCFGLVLEKYPQHWLRKSVQTFPFRRLALAQVMIRMVKCWYRMICWVLIKGSPLVFFADMLTSMKPCWVQHNSISLMSRQ